MDWIWQKEPNGPNLTEMYLTGPNLTEMTKIDRIKPTRPS